MNSTFSNEANSSNSNRLECSGSFKGESIAAAIRRHVAWISLAQKQRIQGGDDDASNRDIEEAANALLTLSLEVDELEGELAFLNAKGASKAG